MGESRGILSPGSFFMAKNDSHSHQDEKSSSIFAIVLFFRRLYRFEMFKIYLRFLSKSGKYLEKKLLLYSIFFYYIYTQFQPLQHNIFVQWKNSRSTLKAKVEVSFSSY